MPQVIFSATALRDLQRLRIFLRPKNRIAAKRAAEAIINSVKTLEKFPESGRPSDNFSQDFLREMLIEFGDSGYTALYRYQNDRVTVLTIRHQKEAAHQIIDPS